ncbi:MAG TPA: glutamine-hydrolyzing GMP synthase [Treponemataceae bacterium]|jgi:GMP synthase (glutamine-hydrolysing)|nr:glutamine-hydrolyzing GMP synthase [Treponemataceae bacterium]
MRDSIIVLDFGSQYAHLIAKRFRLLGYYSEIASPSTPIEHLHNAKGIVFSGGPSSVYEENVPEFNSEILTLPIPILGLCYGHHLLAKEYGAEVGKAPVGEFGFAQLQKSNEAECPLFKGINLPAQVWMSHQDAVLSLAEGFEQAAFTKDCPYAAVQNLEKNRFGLQFHVEVKDTPCGNDIFKNFASFCGMDKNWDQSTVLDVIMEQIKTDARDKKVLLFLSGGVDSTVAFALLNKALGQERVLGLHIDNGFMRKNESKIIEQRYKAAGFTNFIVEDASESFLKAINKLIDPQLKRKAVGENFISVRNEVTKRLSLADSHWLLAQGTLYPDIIESGGTKNSHVIKTHHNRVEGIQALIAKGLIIEPLKDLYKDEVREIGKKIGLSDELVMRHPFPGPGLSINVLCNSGVLSSEEEREFARAEKKITSIDFTPLFPSIPMNSIKTSILPVKSVGVQGDFRTYRFPAVLTFTQDIPDWNSLENASSYITNTVSDVNRTVLTLWEKPHCSIQEGYCDKNALDQTREADAVILEELKKTSWYKKIFQHLTIHTTYAEQEGHCSFILRPVVSEDVMTARFAHLDWIVLNTIIERLKKFDFVDALFYDITNKPPATFGWE